MKSGKHHGSSTSIKSGNSKNSNREKTYISLTSSIYSKDIRSSKKIEKLPYGNRSPSSPPERPRPNFLVRDDKFGIQSSSANSCTNCKDVFKKIKSKSTKLSRTPSETNPLNSSRPLIQPSSLAPPKSLATSKLSKVDPPPISMIDPDKEVDSLGIHLSSKFMRYDSPRYNKKHIHDEINPTTLILPSSDNVNVNINGSDLSLDLSKLDSLSVSSRTVFKSVAFSPISTYQETNDESKNNDQNNCNLVNYNNDNRNNLINNTITNNSENLNYYKSLVNNNNSNNNITQNEHNYINYQDININRSEIISSDNNSDQNMTKKKEIRRVSFSDNLVQTIYIESIDWDDTSHLYDKVKSTDELIERVRNVREQRRAKSKVLFKFVDNIMNIQNSIGQLNMDHDKYRHKSRTLKKK